MKKLSTIFFLMLMPTMSIAQMGTLKARVIDDKTGQPIYKASVQIVETKQGAYTKQDGYALVVNIHPGPQYTVAAKYVGYEPSIRKEVQIKDGDTTELIIKLKTAVQKLVIVEASPVIDKSETLQGTTNNSSYNSFVVDGNSSSIQGNVSTFSVSELNVTTSGVITDGSSGGFVIGGARSTSNSNRIGGVTATERVDLSHNTNARIYENAFHDSRRDPLSTFSIDVDNASYSLVRNYIESYRQLPPPDAVRIEEMINYFSYEYPEAKEHPFSVTTEVSDCPWKPEHKLMLIGLQGKKIEPKDIPPSNLVFLIDVSGSMRGGNRLPLVKQSLQLLVEQLRPVDKISIVVYAGASGLALSPTSGSDKRTVISAIEGLEAGGSTAGVAGIMLAYKTAAENYMKDGNNRVILCTDGDFNVGISDISQLTRIIEEKRATGIYLTALGFGMGNYKDDRLESLADKGNGNYAYIDNIKEAKKWLITQMAGTLYTIAKDVKLQLEFNPLKIKGYRLIGYENRILAKEDFNNDKKDAGELGAGHTVTALYELIPVGVEYSAIDSVDDLKYQSVKPTEAATSNQLLTVKLRYKLPQDTTSKLFGHAVTDGNIYSYGQSTDNLRFASSVAQFGMVMRGSEHKGSATIEDVLTQAKNSLGKDENKSRADFIRMVESYKQLNTASLSK